MNEWEGNDMQFLRATGAAMERCRLQCHSWMSSSFQKGHDMQKGFGFYSPHETTILFLKATLVSIWVGLDLVVLFTVYGMTPSMHEYLLDAWIRANGNAPLTSW